MTPFSHRLSRRLHGRGADSLVQAIDAVQSSHPDIASRFDRTVSTDQVRIRWRLAALLARFWQVRSYDRRARSAILIYGTGGSGTSVTAELTDRLGAPAGDWPGKGQPEPRHKRGRYSDPAVEAFNNQVLKDLGCKIFELPPVEAVEQYAARNPRKAELHKLLSKFDGFPFFSMKDPNFGTLFPLWQCALLERGYTHADIIVVNCVRNLDFVARSLRALGKGFEQLSEQELRAFLLEDLRRWKRNTRHVQNVIVHFDSLLARPIEEAGRLALALGLPSFSRELIEGVVDPSQRHHGNSENDDTSLSKIYEQWRQGGVI